MNELQLNTIESYNKVAYEFFETIAKLDNYNRTYDELITKLNENSSILDLACGPGQISKYISRKISVEITGVDLSDSMLKIAQQEMPVATFYKHSIVNFKSDKKFHAVLIGFGIPYLDKSQTEECIKNASNLLFENQFLYISFMSGEGSRVEKTSFGGDNKFILYFHNKEDIKNILEVNDLKIVNEYELDYQEKDGSISKDIIFIGQKFNKLE